jgi:hypothetical protein
MKLLPGLFVVVEARRPSHGLRQRLAREHRYRSATG